MFVFSAGLKEGGFVKKMILLISFALLIPVILCGQDKNEPPIWSVGDNLYGQDKVGAPVWGVGDNWTWKNSDGTILNSEVVKTETNLYLVKMDEDPDLYGYDKKTMNVNLLIKKDGRRFPVDFFWRRAFDFPIFVGKRWSYTSHWKSEGWRMGFSFIHEFRIDAVENITTPAGVFKCYKIRLDLTDMGFHRYGTGTIHYWYSPEVKHWIKREADYAYHWLQEQSARNAELISYKVIRK